MDRNTINFWVGVFVLLGFGALLVLALKVGNLSLTGREDTYAVSALFNNVGGLKVRAPVRASGVTVGRVTGIEFDPAHYQASVHFEIKSKYRFPSDTSASILTSGVLGENYVGLDAGAEESMLGDGDQVLITQSAVILERLIGRFMYDKAQEPGARLP